MGTFLLSYKGTFSKSRDTKSLIGSGPADRISKIRKGRHGTGRLYKRGVDGGEHSAHNKGPGNYWLEYRLNGERKRQALKHDDGTPITDLREAETERRRILAPIQTGDQVETLKAIEEKLRKARQDHAKAVDESLPPLSISQVWHDYLANASRPDSGDSTLRQYAFQWQRFVDWVAKAHPEVHTLREVSPEIARNYANDLSQNRLSPNTFNKHIRLLEMVFRVLAETAQIDVNPWQRITRKKQTASGRRELTTEELRRVCLSAPGDLKLLLALGIYTGLRLGDCATLKWDEVDLARGYIARIPNKTLRTKGTTVQIPLYRDLANMLKDARQQATSDYVLPDWAASYHRRPDIITDQIQRHLLINGINCHKKGTGYQIKRNANGSPVFNATGGVKLEYTGKRAVVECGFHSLRHSFVSLCREAGAPLAVVEAIVGHSNPAMTRHYSHIGEQAGRMAVALLPSVLRQDPTPSTKVYEPIPSWARELITSMTPKNCKKVKALLLSGPEQLG